MQNEYKLFNDSPSCFHKKEKGKKSTLCYEMKVCKMFHNRYVKWTNESFQHKHIKILTVAIENPDLSVDGLAGLSLSISFVAPSNGMKW